MLHEYTYSLFEEMGQLQSAVNRIGEYWNDRVATAVSVEQVNELISCCNKMNSDISQQAMTIDQRMAQLQNLVDMTD